MTRYTDGRFINIMITGRTTAAAASRKIIKYPIQCRIRDFRFLAALDRQIKDDLESSGKGRMD